jgi:hypothetical protein
MGLDVDIMGKLKALSQQQAAQFLARKMEENESEARMKRKLAERLRQKGDA